MTFKIFKFSKLNWENIAWRYLLKSQKCLNCKVLPYIIATTITQLNSLFVLYYWSSWCRNLMNLLMKCAQFINSYQKSTLGRPIMKPFVLFFYVLPRHTNITTGKVFNFFDSVLPDVHICSHRKKSAPLHPEGTVKCKCTSSSIANSQRMQTKINKSGTIVKIRI